MPIHPDAVFLALIGVIVTFGTSILIVATKRWHSVFTFDTSTGIQKLHERPTPRVGGFAVFLGFWAAASATSPPLRDLLFALGMSGSVAFLAGLAEDVTKRVSTTLRLLATMLSGLLFCVMTGYSVTRVDIHFIDHVMALPVVSLAFTTFALAGLVNSVNLIDGLHGLAVGAVIIMVLAFAVVAYTVDDHQLVWFAVVIAAVLLGFWVVNFPQGHLFLGDGGAYFSGLLLGSLAVMLPMRNPDISAWVSLGLLGYLVLDTMHAVLRRTFRVRHWPTRPDGLHLHGLLYRQIAKWIGKPEKKWLANSSASAVVLGWILIWSVFMTLIPHTWEWSLLIFSLQTILYVVLYRRVALLRHHRIFRLPRGLSKRL